MTLPGAYYAFEFGIHTDRSNLDRQCPFGGWIRINSLSVPPPNTVYRIMARQANPPDPTYTGTPLADPVKVAILGAIPPASPTGVNIAYSDGYFDYLSRDQNFWGDLASWTPTIDGLWQIRLETATKTGHNHLAYTPWYNILVNNERPTGDLRFTTGSICSELFIGRTLRGEFYTTMTTTTFFDMYEFSLSPAGLIPSTISPSGGTSPVPPYATWTLDTTNGTACGYVVRLYSQALTVYQSSPYVALDFSTSRGFCLRTPT
jgi:hypothetical protein